MYFEKIKNVSPTLNFRWTPLWTLAILVRNVLEHSYFSRFIYQAGTSRPTDIGRAAREVLVSATDLHDGLQHLRQDTMTNASSNDSFSDEAV